MPQFSKILLPPILDYNYPAFQYETEDGGNVQVSFPAYLSITNTIEQVDHAQVRIVSLDTNKNALNPILFPTGICFISMQGAKDLTIKLNTIINGINIFSSVDENAYPSYYKMQIRLGINGNNNYDKSWGQNVDENWIKENSENFSEWSNSAILKTVKKPDFGIYTLDSKKVNTLRTTNYLWQGFYNTEDGNEDLQSYYFQLSNDIEILETSPEKYIGEYETPNLSHTFSEVFENEKTYYITLFIKTVTGYVDSITYTIKAEFSYVKLYNVYEVKENDDDAHNEIIIKAKQVQLEYNGNEDDLIWLQDKTMNDEFGETGATHVQILNGGRISTDNEFVLPYQDFSMLLATTNFESKIQNRLLDCFKNNNYLCYIGTKENNGSDFYLGALYKNNKYYLVLKEILKLSLNDFIQYYYIEVDKNIEKNNNEYIILIKKHNGETIFEAKNWIANQFY